MKDLFEWTVASVTGLYHHQMGSIPCQDAYQIRAKDDSLLFLVADGFTGHFATSLNHLGVNLSARAAANRLETLLVEAMETKSSAETFSQGLGKVSDLIRKDVDRLARSVQMAYEAYMLPSEKSPAPTLKEVLSRAFMFTLIGVVVTREWTQVFACGDGEIHLNGVRHGLPEPPSGRPDVLTDGLLDAMNILDGACDLQPIVSRPTSEVNHLVIGTDGLAPLYDEQGQRLFLLPDPVPWFSRLWEEDAFFTDPETLRLEWVERSLPGCRPRDGLLLHGDTTGIVLRRRATEVHDTLPSPAPKPETGE